MQITAYTNDITYFVVIELSSIINRKCYGNPKVTKTCFTSILATVIVSPFDRVKTSVHLGKANGIFSYTLVHVITKTFFDSFHAHSNLSPFLYTEHMTTYAYSPLFPCNFDHMINLFHNAVHFIFEDF